MADAGQPLAASARRKACAQAQPAPSAYSAALALIGQTVGGSEYTVQGRMHLITDHLVEFAAWGGLVPSVSYLLIVLRMERDESRARGALPEPRHYASRAYRWLVG